LDKYPLRDIEDLRREAVMQHNRFRRQEGFVPLSPVVATMPAAGAFLACPMVLSSASLGQASPSLAVYQRAYECAQAVAQPSLLERLQTATLN
jgi:hypothetical protein